MPTSDGSDARLLINELSRINSELATAQRASARATAEVAARKARVKQYVGMVAHDLNNPLQVVLGLAELMLHDDDLTDVQRDRVTRIVRSADLMRALVQDLSEGLDPERQDLVDRAPVDVRDLVESVVGRHQVLTATKHLTIELVPCPSSEGACVVSGDVVRLERALNNLLGNAVKFSPEGGAITVRLSREGDRAVVEVADQGPGIPAESQERVFEMFHRELATAHVPGVGLGLYITRQIAEAHGGTVTVRSEPGQGAAFLLALPLSES